MNPIDQIKRRVFGNAPATSPLIALFPDVAAAAAVVAERSAICVSIEERISELTSQLGRERDAFEADLERHGAATLDGEPTPVIRRVSDNLRTAQADLELANSVFREARARYNVVLASKSTDVCGALRQIRRRRLRQLARTLSAARRLAEQDQALTDALLIGGVQMDWDFIPLHFAPVLHWSNASSPLDQWFATLRRFGILHENEDPAAIAEDGAALDDSAQVPAEGEARKAPRSMAGIYKRHIGAT